MESMTKRRSKAADSGFSMVEMLMVIIIVSIVVTAVLAQVNQTQQRATAEQNKLDQFAAARNFVDQIATDVRQMGYPNSHSFDVSQGTWQNPLKNDSRIAAGLVKLTSNSIQFEGDVDGSGQVSIVSYAVNGDGACATCLERAQVTPKANGDPVAQAPATGAYTAEIQNVQNASSTSNPIFKAFDVTGAPITLPIDIDNNPALVAKVRVIQVSLDVSDPSQFDPKTGQALEARLGTRVQVVNCSMAGSASALGISQIAGGAQLVCQP